MNKRLGTLFAGLLVLGMAGQAFALDGFRDRRGLFFGVNLAGGTGQAVADGETVGDRSLGLTVGARVGGGINKRLTLDLSIDGFFLTQNQELAAGIERQIDTTLLSGMIGGSLFLVDGIYVRGMGGLANASSSVDGPGGKSTTDETGLGLGLGGGYEFFANSNLAIGAGVDYRMFVFDDVNYNVFNVGITATWY
jgi:hypothetical protein